MKVNEASVPQPSENDRARRRSAWESMRPLSASEVLGILQPTSHEPPAVMALGLWKTGSLPAPQAAS